MKHVKTKLKQIAVCRAVANSIIGGGADIHIYVFTHHKSNRFQKELIVQNTNIWISAPPPPIIEIATALAVCSCYYLSFCKISNLEAIFDLGHFFIHPVVLLHIFKVQVPWNYANSRVIVRNLPVRFQSPRALIRKPRPRTLKSLSTVTGPVKSSYLYLNRYFIPICPTPWFTSVHLHIINTWLYIFSSILCWYY